MTTTSINCRNCKGTLVRDANHWELFRCGDCGKIDNLSYWGCSPRYRTDIYNATNGVYRYRNLRGAP